MKYIDTNNANKPIDLFKLAEEVRAKELEEYRKNPNQPDPCLIPVNSPDFVIIWPETIDPDHLPISASLNEYLNSTEEAEFQTSTLDEQDQPGPPMNSHPRIDPQTRGALVLFSAALVKRFDIRQLILYGSRARGDHRADSDADVAVLLDCQPRCNFDVLLGMADVAFDVMLETGILISPLPIWIEEWERPEKFSNPALLKNIRNDGIVL